MFSQLIKKNRTKRIFNNEQMTFKGLKEIIEDCRFSASTMNRQDIQFILIINKEAREKIFHLTNLPSTHQIDMLNMPAAYVVFISNRDINLPDNFLYYNIGILTANFSLSATSKGYSSVTLMSTNFDKLGQVLSLDKSKKALSMIGIGKSDQKVEIEDIEKGDTHYYKSESGVHTVPKRTCQSLIYSEI